MFKSWRQTTLNSYYVYINKWIAFCERKNFNPKERHLIQGLDFLRHLLKNNHSYSALNTARSALSNIFDGPPFGEDPLVIRFMKSAYTINPAIPKYHNTWDVAVVLKFLEKWSPSRFLSRKQLTFKLVTLLALVSGQRVQTLEAFNINHCHFDSTCATFSINKLLKHNSAKHKDNHIIIPYFTDNKKICPVSCLKQYIKRTKRERNSSQLFISLQAPYNKVSKSTISRWIKLTLTEAGVDTDIYKSHSTRAASTSAAAKSIDISLIMKAGSWTRAATFGRYYNKSIEDDRPTFGKAVLKRL